MSRDEELVHAGMMAERAQTAVFIAKIAAELSGMTEIIVSRIGERTASGEQWDKFYTDGEPGT